MMPNKTYEMRNLYFLQSADRLKSVKDSVSSYSMVTLPTDWNFKPLRLDVDLMQDAFKDRADPGDTSIAEQVFGAELDKHTVTLKHAANLLAERSALHQRHLKEIDRRHIEAQEKLFGAQINHTPENAKRVLSLEGMLAQFDKERRDEEVAFWKDTVDLRQQLLESGWNYRDAHQRSVVFSDVEANHDRQ
jgi:hypothetical protein